MSTSFASRTSLRLLTVASTLLFAATTTATTEELCGISQAWPTANGEYIFNNNAWGADGSGASCTDVPDDGSSFQTIWSWANNGNNTHGFPNVQLNSAALFPLALTDLAAMNLQAKWSYDQIDGATRANVVYDMFADTDKSNAANVTGAKYEIMIWIGAYGDPFPLGASINPFTGVVNASLPSQTLGGTTFNLYSGENDGGQTVHTWLAIGNDTDFNSDASPLITYLTKNNLVDSSAFLGTIQFGSETWHSTANVTFDVSSFNINITSTNASVNAAASSAISGATATSGSSGASSTGSSGSSGSSSSSSSSSSSTGSSGSSTIALPIWLFSAAAAGTLFTLL